ncbi:hypothetical protein BH09VER1_BH09VER1_18630 [soil metagenome]
MFKVHYRSDASAEKRTDVDALVEGRKCFEKKDYPNATEWLLTAVERTPDSFESHLYLGQALFHTERWFDAAPHFRRAVELKPDSQSAQEWLGNNYLGMGKFELAAEILTRAEGKSSLKSMLRLALDLLRRPDLFNGVVNENPHSDSVQTQARYARRRNATREFADKSFGIGKPNIIWRKSARGRFFRVRPKPVISPDSKIFTMGSCFALEIRDALKRRGFQVYPQYSRIEFDDTRCLANLLPAHENINHYDTFTIRQEFENAFAGSHFPEESFWKVEGTPINKALEQETVWQDPHRRNVLALDQSDIIDISRKIDDSIRQGVLDADVYVITLGLIETWVNRVDPRFHACSYPGAGGAGKEADFHLSTFLEDYQNIRRVCELILGKFPDKQIILTVSPVALERTFRDIDVVIANMESKCQLRTVAGQINREFENVHYLPSFETFIYHDIYHEDGRHASRDGVEMIVDRFGKLFLTGGDQTAPQHP